MPQQPSYRFVWTRSDELDDGVTHIHGTAHQLVSTGQSTPALKRTRTSDDDRDDKPCAEMEVTLCDRRQSLFLMLDEETEEGELLAALFDERGRKPVPAIASHNKWRKSAEHGPLVLIETLRVDPEHRGAGLGLKLMDDLLERELVPAPSAGASTQPGSWMQRPQRSQTWSLAALRPFPLTSEEGNGGAAAWDLDRLRRYFARAGFWAPAGVASAQSLHGFWFSVRETREKLTIEQANALVLPPNTAAAARMALSDADKELKRKFDVVDDAGRFNNAGPPSENEVRALLARGADLARTHALHHCASMEWKLPVFEMFIRLGADVNNQNGKGETPLHILAVRAIGSREEKTNEIIRIVRRLVEVGANRTLLDEKGQSPASIVVDSFQSYAKKYGERDPSIHTRLINVFEALLSDEQRAGLVHGCLSPRMMYRLKVASEVCYDVCNDSLENYTPREPLELWQVDDVWLMDRIPVEVRARDIYPSFVRGWIEALKAVRDTFGAGEALTISNVRRRFEGMYANHFEQRGGSVAHAIDAVLYRSESESDGVYSDGDGTFFEVPEFEDEHNALPAMPDFDDNYTYVRHKFGELNGAPLPEMREGASAEDYIAANHHDYDDDDDDNDDDE